jgi:BirA family transcriptional regulator, biotin operon repressor / biotin---[acetyl-CoA-carboxylase] ligase
VTGPSRPGLDTAALRASLPKPWTAIDVVEVTESTNTDLVGAETGSVLVAEYQRAGRGRLDRSWASPPRASLLFSAVVRPAVAPARWGWLPLLTGVALCDAITTVTGLEVALKWPNDLLATANSHKLAGVLVQVSNGAAIIGVGLNVSTTRDELPVPTATSLALESAISIDRGILLTAILAALGVRYLDWIAAEGDAEASGLADAYRARCSTIGQEVLVSRIGDPLQGSAVGIDADGRLRLRLDGTGNDTDSGAEKREHVVAAGDIVHLRPTG